VDAIGLTLKVAGRQLLLELLATGSDIVGVLLITLGEQ